MVETHDSKMTILGALPIDWEVSNIQDCFQKNEKIKIGPFGSQLKKEYLLPRGDYYVYGQENVYQDDFHICYRFLSFERFNSLKSCEIRPGDFVVSTMGTIGKCAVVPDYAHIGIMDSHLVRMRFNDSIYKPFFAYMFRSRIIQDQIRKLSVGGIMEGLSTSILKKIDVIVPPIQEQKRIAGALLSVDKMIGALDEAITKKSQIKEGLMQQLLTGEAVIPEYSGEWQKKRVGDIGFTYSGLTGKTKNDFGHGEAQYITFLNVLNNPVLNTDAFEKVNVRSDERQNAAKKGDLFFNTSSETPEEVGICALLSADINNLYLNSFCFGFRLTDPDVDGLYLSYFWRSKQGREIMSALAQGATRYNLSKEYFNKAIITLPPIELQRYIANTITVADKEIAELEQKRDKYLLIKQGMMQELLTGKTRLV